MARTYNVTSTINSNIVTIMTADATKIVSKGYTDTTPKIAIDVNDCMTIKNVAIAFAKDMTEDNKMKAIRNKIDSNAIAILKETAVSALYGMTDEDFYKISYKLEETDSRRDLITRTLKACIAKVQVFDMTNKEMKFTDVPMDTGFDKLPADKQLAQVRKKIETAELVPLAVTGCDMREELRGTTKEKFIDKAVPLNPETRQPYNTEETES